MKKNFLIATILFTAFASQAQSDRKLYDVGLSSSVSIFNYSYRGTLNPYVSFKKDQKSFTVGPLILAASNADAYVSNGPKLTGLSAAYKFHPYTQNERLELYLSTEILAQRIKDSWQANAYDPGLKNFRDVDYQNVELLFEGYAGYGIRLNLGKSWYLSQGVGIGLYYSILNGDEFGGEVLELDNFDYRGYDDFGFSWKLKLGIGFKF